MKEKSLRKGLKAGAMAIFLLLLVGGVFAGNVVANQSNVDKNPIPLPDQIEREKHPPSDVSEYMKFLKGKIIGKGKKLDNGNCLVNYTVTGWGDSNNNYGSLNITVTEDCKVVVTDVLLKYDTNPKIPDIDPSGTYERHNDAKGMKIDSLLSSLSILLGGAVEREGWAYQEYEEQFHIDVTKAWVEMDYWDSGSKVYSGHDQWLNLWWRSGTGWFKIAHGLWYSLGGPSIVWIEGYGEYDNNSWPIPYELWHRLWVEFEGYPGGTYSWSCSFEGEKPPFWHTHCNGGIRSPT